MQDVDWNKVFKFLWQAMIVAVIAIIVIALLLGILVGYYAS